MKLALKHKKDLQSLQNTRNAAVTQGKSYGAILTLQKIAKEIGIANALGATDNGKTALWQVIGRTLLQGSRLSLIRAKEIHAAEELLDITAGLTAKMLYTNLSWIERNQEAIEKKLQKSHGVKENKNLYLYDVILITLNKLTNISPFSITSFSNLISFFNKDIPSMYAGINYFINSFINPIL